MFYWLKKLRLGDRSGHPAVDLGATYQWHLGSDTHSRTTSSRFYVPLKFTRENSSTALVAGRDAPARR
jgi:hypothetical protein